jgi:hypothetical protein
MPRESRELPPPLAETPAGLREMAARARRLARHVLDEVTIDKLSEFARELEARAATLETAPQSISHDEAAAGLRADPDLRQS